MYTRPITDQDLMAYAAGEIEGEAARRVETRLDSDPAAARRVALYRLTADTLAGDDSVAPPPATVARAKAIFNRRPVTPRPSLIERLEAVVAQLVFDSRLQPLAVRASDASRRFQLAFEADAAEVDLQGEFLPGAEPAGDRWRLMGQVSAASSAANVEVVLTRAGEPTTAAETHADPGGVFAVNVSPGRYDIRVHLPAGLIVLPDVEVA